MATTRVHKYTEPIVLDVEAIREIAQDWLEQLRGDEDKAGDIEDSCYYEGGADALESILKQMTGQTETPAEAVINDDRARANAKGN